MTRHYIGRKTIRTSAFFQIIVKDFQELKISKENKIPQEYLDRKKKLLIENAFKRSYNLTNLSQTQEIDLCKKV